MTTTTAQAGRVMQHLEFCLRRSGPESTLQLVSVSEQWAQIAVAGPKSRDSFRRSSMRSSICRTRHSRIIRRKEITFGGITARLFRISFSGEIAYELAVPARYGEGGDPRDHGGGRGTRHPPYGAEALGVMRIEKGHVAHRDQRPGDPARSRLRPHDVEEERLHRPRDGGAARAAGGTDRPALVGFKPVDKSARLRAGAHFLGVGVDAGTIKNDQGYMTSVAFSPSLDHWIGLGVIARGPQRIGERVRAYDPVRNGDVEVEICDPVFIEP